MLLEELANRLDQAAGALRSAAKEVAEVRGTKVSEWRKRALAAEEALDEMTKRWREEHARAADLGAMNRRMRRALNGAGCNPLDVHALHIFQALAQAAPNHPLVQPKED